MATFSPPVPSVFLSSTFVDLADIRQNLCRWLSEVFDVDLVVMESFGSDAAPPDVTSVRRVRGCDLFVGIYARRYGTVDPTTGRSITEMELDEAERAYSSGSVKDLLLYLLDENAAWPAASVHDVGKLEAYKDWNRSEHDERSTPAACGKASALGRAIARTAKPEFAASLRKSLSLIGLTPSSRPLVLALLSNGEVDDVNLVLGRIAECTTQIEYRDRTELGQAVARRMMFFRTTLVALTPTRKCASAFEQLKTAPSIFELLGYAAERQIGGSRVSQAQWAVPQFPVG